jgi:16S rRNA (cytosine967-C5)-methyltransferase
MSLDTIGSATPAVLRHTHLRLAAAALTTVLGGGMPADAALRELYARHRNAGARDRAQVGVLFYGVLRDFFPLRAALGESASALELCAAHALRAGRANAETMPRLEGVEPAALAERVARARDAELDDATRHNLPGWLWQRLAAQYGAEAGALARALNEPATVDLRVNTLKATREAAAGALQAEGIASEPTPRSPVGLRLARREALQRTRAFRDGWIEPQDEGSQLLAAFVEPRAGETVADFCAGAGGKTLALGAAMRDRGTLHALDVSRERLARLAPRLQRSGLSIVRPQVLRSERDPRLNALAETCDAVLVDAPCSATGTLRRNPETRLRTPDLAALAAQQGAILGAAARLVRPGGRLVYATCSVLAEENERVVEAFLAAHPAFTRQAELVLLPHRDGTDGFYAARLKK